MNVERATDHAGIERAVETHQQRATKHSNGEAQQVKMLGRPRDYRLDMLAENLEMYREGWGLETIELAALVIALEGGFAPRHPVESIANARFDKATDAQRVFASRLLKRRQNILEGR